MKQYRLQRIEPLPAGVVYAEVAATLASIFGIAQLLFAAVAPLKVEVTRGAVVLDTAIKAVLTVAAVAIASFVFAAFTSAAYNWWSSRSGGFAVTLDDVD